MWEWPAIGDSQKYPRLAAAHPVRKTPELTLVSGGGKCARISVGGAKVQPAPVTPNALRNKTEAHAAQRHIIHTRQHEIPQLRDLPGTHKQKGQTEDKDQKDHIKGEVGTQQLTKKTGSCSCRKLSLNILQHPIQIILFCQWNSSQWSLSALLCLQTKHCGNSFPGVTHPWIISKHTFSFQDIYFSLEGSHAIGPTLINKIR